MDLENPVVQLCIKGTQAEFAGNLQDACALYQRAWQQAQDDFEACVAAHYVARCQKNSADTLHWNQEALRRAALVQDGRVQDFYPSLYLNLGLSYEMLGQHDEAQHYFQLAGELREIHQGD